MMNPNNFPPKSKVYLTPAEANYSPPHIEGPFGPSMVEPCHNLSIEELVRDYTRGIIHTERQAFYDEGDEVQEVSVYQDIAEMEPTFFENYKTSPGEERSDATKERSDKGAADSDAAGEARERGTGET